MSRVDQINSLLRQELALSLNRQLDLPGALVTVSEVRCSPDLHEAKVFVSVLPERLAGTALEKLRHISGELAHDLRKRLKFHHMPIFVWHFDQGPSNVTAIDNLLKDPS